MGSLPMFRMLNLLIVIAALQKTLCLPLTTRAVVDLPRQLLVLATCPPGCHPQGCQSDGTAAGLRCSKCIGRLVVNATTGACGCPAGRYVLAGDCTDCSKGSYCTGGSYTLEDPPQQQPYPANMTTRGIRANSIRSCVNLPGHSYALDSAGAVSAVECSADTYCPGLKKQRACVPCPTGFTTSGQTGQYSPAACVVPGGSYLKGPGQVAACPKGEYKAGVGAAGNCTKCPTGVTTQQAASDTADACKVLQPGFYAASITPGSRAITAAAVCPQGFFCGGGLPVSTFDPSDPTALSATEPSIRLCPQGTLTKGLGATSEAQCLTPPGFYIASGQTLQCPDGSFRPNWLPAAEAANCTACGDGLVALKSDAVTVYDIVTGQAREIPVTTAAEDCYIQPGQGLYYATLTGTWRARNCDNDTYGVPNITFGLTPAPCKDCPRGLVARRDAAYGNSARWYVSSTAGAGGFVSVLACVTQPGWGYNSRVSQLCDQGTYNEGDNLSPCRPCPLGLTTTGVGAGKSLSDCKAAPGYGAGRLCPAGTFNDAVSANASSPCTQCPTGTTTAADGATSAADCGLCVSGYGGTGCGTRCGGVGDAASYGPPGRAVGSPCVSCSSGGVTIGYSFSWNLQNDLFTPQTVSRAAASSPVDCLSECSQLKDGAWFLPLSSNEGTNITTDVPTFADCVAVCSANRECQLLTYDYRAQTCLVRRRVEGDMVSDPWLALKAMPAGFSAASAHSSQQQQQNTTRAQSSATGVYTFTHDAYAASVGIQVAPTNVSSFTSVEDCLVACDYSPDCAGFTIQQTVAKEKMGTTCMLIKGNTQEGRFLRTAVRTDADRAGLPSSLCPSGFDQADGVSLCVPITTIQQVTFVLIVTGTCDAAALESVRAAVLAMLSDPAVSYGVYTPTLKLTADCMVLLPSAAPSGRRRLQSTSDGQVIISVKAEMTGAADPATGLARKIQEDPCSVPGACTNFTDAAPVLVSATPIQSASVVYDMYEYAPSSLKIKSTYKVDGSVVDMTSVFDTAAGTRVPCTSVLAQGSRLYTCNITAGTAEGLQLTATAPNVAKVTKPLVQVVSYTGAVCSTSPGNVTNGYFSCNPTSLPGSSCTATCLGSFVGTPSVTRLASGAWGDIQGACTAITTCSSTSASVSNGNITCAGATVQSGATCSVSCNTGFTSATTTVTCTAGTFSPAACDVCLAGYAGANCTPCSVGTSSAGGSAGADLVCTPCATGRTTTGTAAASCSQCKANYAGEGCIACDAGSTSPGGTASSSLVCTSSCVTPTLTVTAPAAPIHFCSNSAASALGVTFRVQSDTGDSISVPRTITSSDERVCTAQGSITNLLSPSSVTYACPQIDNRWTPADFTLQATAFAGVGDCLGQGSSRPADISIMKQPTVFVEPSPSDTVTLCSSDARDYVEVGFVITVNTRTLITVPATLTASDGRVCTVQGDTTTDENGFNVVYSCPRLNGAWTPGTFTVQLTASGGQPGCFNTGTNQAKVLSAPCVSNYTVANIDRPFESACSLGGVFQVLADADDMVFGYGMPFYVALYDTFLTTAMISSNGFIAFAGDNPFPTKKCSLPWIDPNAAPQGAIFAYWDNLVLSSTGVCIATTGTAPNQEVVLTWENARVANSQNGALVSCSIILTEGSLDVDVVYGNFVDDGGPGLSATVGMQDRNAIGYSTTGTMWRSCDVAPKAETWSNTAIRFTGVV